MADTLAEQLGVLERERDRLEQYLALDADWRALRQLDEREAAGDPVEAVDGRELRWALVRALSANRIYAARAKIVEAIGLLSGTASTEAAAMVDSRLGLSALRPRGRTISRRIVILAEEVSGPKTRSEPRPPDAQSAGALSVDAAASPSGAAMTTTSDVASRPDIDRLDLICGLEPEAVSRLTAAGVRCCDLARWGAAEVTTWRQQLADCARGPVGHWIEQAAMLSNGRMTRYARQTLTGGRPALATMPPPEPQSPISPAPFVAPQIVSPVAPVAIIQIDAEAPSHCTGLGAEIATADVSGNAGGDAGIEVREAEGESMAASALHRFASDEAEFEVLAKRPQPPPLPPSSAKVWRGSLLSRLRESREPERFDSARYAAYRGAVEEASVTIIRSEGPAPGKAVAPPQPPAVEDRPAPVDRFLNALLGKP